MLHRTIFRILKDVSSGMLGFEVPRLPEKLPKSIQNQKKSHQKGDRFSNDFSTHFFLIFIDFGFHLGLHFFSKIAQKRTPLLKGPPLFLNFNFYRFLGVPPARNFHDFPPSQGRFFNLSRQIFLLKC